MLKSKLTRTGYELESVNIVQAPISYIKHRSECDPMVEINGRRVYPVIVAPMGSVTDENNYKVWLEHGFMCCVPRTVDYLTRIEISKETFASFSLAEAETMEEHIDDGKVHYTVLIVENPKSGSLGSQPRCILLGVAVFNAYQDQQTVAYGGDAFAVHRDGRLGNPLNNYSHNLCKGKLYSLFFIILRLNSLKP